MSVGSREFYSIKASSLVLRRYTIVLVSSIVAFFSYNNHFRSKLSSLRPILSYELCRNVRSAVPAGARVLEQPASGGAGGAPDAVGVRAHHAARGRSRPAGSLQRHDARAAPRARAALRVRGARSPAGRRSRALNLCALSFRKSVRFYSSYPTHCP